MAFFAFTKFVFCNPGVNEVRKTRASDQLIACRGATPVMPDLSVQGWAAKQSTKPSLAHHPIHCASGMTSN